MLWFPSGRTIEIYFRWNRYSVIFVPFGANAIAEIIQHHTLYANILWVNYRFVCRWQVGCNAVSFISEGNRGKQPNKPQRNCITAVSTTPWHGRISSYTQWISRLKQILQNEYMTQIVVAKYLKCYVFLCLFRFDHVKPDNLLTRLIALDQNIVPSFYLYFSEEWRNVLRQVYKHLP
jgi:hypothetical protein